MIQETAAGGRFRDRVRALPTWVFVLALYATIAAAQSFKIFKDSLLGLNVYGGNRIVEDKNGSVLH